MAHGSVQIMKQGDLIPRWAREKEANDGDDACVIHVVGIGRNVVDQKIKHEVSLPTSRSASRRPQILNPICQWGRSAECAKT